MSKTGVQSDCKDGGAHEFTHENKNIAINLNSLTNSATNFVCNGEPMLFKSEDAVPASPLSSEAEIFVARISSKSVVNDADLEVIKTIPHSGKRTITLDNNGSNIECSNSKIDEISTQTATSLELDGFVGEDIFEMGTGAVGVSTETISLPLPLPIALDDSTYLGSDFTDNLKDFDGPSFSALLGSEDSISDTLQVPLYDDSDPIGRVKDIATHAKEDPTMTSVVTKRNDGIVFNENELLNFTSLIKASPPEFEKPANVKTDPAQNVFQSYSNANDNLFMTLKSDDKLISSPCKFQTTASSFPSTIMTSLSNINDISSSLNVVPNFHNLDDLGNSLVKVKNPTLEIGSSSSMSYGETQQEDINSTIIPEQPQQTLSNQNVNVTTISISNKENNSIKILVHSDEGQNVYVINSADLDDGKGSNKLMLNENQTIFANSEDLNQTVTGNSKSFEVVPSTSDSSYFHPNSSSPVSGIFLVPVQPQADAENEKSSRKKIMVCNEPGCNKTFKKASKLKVHKMLHTGERPFKCTFPGCIWAFTTSHKLKRHLESHKGRKDFACDYPGCGHKFTTIYNLNTHRKLHQRPYTEACTEEGCGEAFHTKRQLEVHLRAAHKIEEKTFKCPNTGCEKVFFSSGCMGSHMRVHAQNLENFKCKFGGCDKEFNKLCRLRQHEKLHTGEKPFICTYEGCSWAFATASKLKRHLTKHTGVRKWQCHICRKFFQRSEHLKGHLITHSGDRPFACPVEGCGNAFTAKSSLYVHLRKHDESGKTIVYHCPMDKCDRVYACKTSLRQHILVKHCSLPTDAGNSEPAQRVVGWLNLLDPNDAANAAVAATSTDPNLVQEQLPHDEVLVQTALAADQEASVINADFLSEGMSNQTLLNSTPVGTVVMSDPQTCGNLIHHSQMVVVSNPVSHITASPSPSTQSTLVSLPTTSAVASSVVVDAHSFQIDHHHLQQQQHQHHQPHHFQHQQQHHQQNVIEVGELLQTQQRMSNETLERGKKRQFVFDNMQGSVRTDERSNEIISQRAFKRWQKQKEIEAAKLRAHLEAQSVPVHSSSASSTNPAIIPQRVSVSVADLTSPDSSNVSLASQANTQPSNRGGNSAMIFKEIPDLELQAEGIQGSVLDGRLSTPSHGDSFMTELFIKDPETGLTYRQTQLLQDDPPTLCLLEDMAEVEPSHNVVLDAGLEGNLMEESLSFQDLE